jgi:hypothetical protein
MQLNILKLLIHPLFIFAIIAMLECIPVKTNSTEEILYEMPAKGDNFRVKGNEAVYFYSGKGKYSYPDIECFYSYGNPTFDVHYKDGGIKTIEKSIADQIPHLGSMCEREKKIIHDEQQKSSLNQYLSVNYLFFNFSEIAHILAYMLLAFFTIFHFRLLKHNYLLSFISCFVGGAFLEIIQYCFITGRSASWDDQALNTYGILGGAIFFRIFGRSKIIKRISNL